MGAPEPQPDAVDETVEPYFQLPEADDTAISTSVPDDMPPPAAPAVGAQPQEGDLDARALRALSRQERKEAKAALRREQKEARDAARQARAAAKIAAKTGQPVSTEPLLPAEDEADIAPAPDTESADASATAAAEVAEVAEVADVSDTPAEEEATQPIAAVTDADSGPGAPSAPTDPRSRAAQRVQRRLGKDEEKTSAAEARARAREEARRRRAQAKELRSGVAVEEPVIREPEDEPVEDADLVEAVVDEPAVEETAVFEPVADEPEPEPGSESESDAEVTAVAEPVVDEAAHGADDAVAEDSLESMPPPTVNASEPDVSPEPDAATTTTWEPSHPATDPDTTTDTSTDTDAETKAEGRSPVGPIAGVLGLVCLGVSVLLAVGALLVALGVDSGMFYNALETVANALVGPLKNAFDFGGANAERKEHFIAWGAGSIVYLVLSFAGQAVQRANTEE